MKIEDYAIIAILLCLQVFLNAEAFKDITESKNKETGEYQQGYKDAKLIYECDHDRTECEILKDTL